MEQSVCMSLPSARPIVHMLLYSPVTARAAVAIPIQKAPASAELMYVFMFYLLSVGDLRRSFQNTILRSIGSFVGDRGHAFMTVIIGPKARRVSLALADGAMARRC